MVGARGSPTIVSEISPVEKRRNVEMLSGNAEEKADKLVSRLAEAGIIQ
jgi:electron transfer flavoprotein alpha/beta subunit